MTTMQLFILVDRLCEDCDGQGMVEHPAWRRYWNENMQHQEDDVRARWWSNQGYGYDDRPPQEVTCADCNGAGRIQERLTIAELAALLRPHLAVHP